ncbi:hypothetical protein, partial [Burkholderia sp. LMG 13014]
MKRIILNGLSIAGFGLAGLIRSSGRAIGRYSSITQARAIQYGKPRPPMRTTAAGVKRAAAK